MKLALALHNRPLSPANSTTVTPPTPTEVPVQPVSCWRRVSFPASTYSACSWPAVRSRPNQSGISRTNASTPGQAGGAWTSRTPVTPVQAAEGLALRDLDYAGVSCLHQSPDSHQGQCRPAIAPGAAGAGGRHCRCWCRPGLQLRRGQMDAGQHVEDLPRDGGVRRHDAGVLQLGLGGHGAERTQSAGSRDPAAGATLRAVSPALACCSGMAAG